MSQSRPVRAPDRAEPEAGRRCEQRREESGRKAAALNLIASIAILVLLRTDILAVVVVVATVVVAIVAVGTIRSGCANCGSTVAPTRAIAATITGVARDGAARTTGDGSACYRMRGANTSRITMAAAMEPSSAAVDASGMHAAAVKRATAASAAAGIGIIGNDANGEQYEGCKTGEDAAKHDTSLPRDDLPSESAAVHRAGD